MGKDYEREQEIKDRLADHYTASEICELINVPVEYIINDYWDKILDNLELFFDES